MKHVVNVPLVAIADDIPSSYLYVLKALYDHFLLSVRIVRRYSLAALLTFSSKLGERRYCRGW